MCEVIVVVSCWAMGLSGSAGLSSRPVVFLTSDVSDHKRREGDGCFLSVYIFRKFIQTIRTVIKA